ncbi:MAG TPA: nucleoside 2-deoxyribosyltransferase [Acidimicrobiales bacterium]|nr:nucleoside 2-deoxyribosyltransferase [Acidimicrobiales bacterium]
MPRPKVYLAGPDVFLPNAVEIGARKKELCEQHGFNGVFPLDEIPPPLSVPAEFALATFDICVKMMRACQLAVANLSPFRGVSMDVGTAVELGFMWASGKPVFGYTNAQEDYKVRVEAANVAGDLDVEDFGFFDNLMCESIVRNSGGSVVRHTPARGREFSDLTGFEECLAQAAQVLLESS